MLKPTDKRHSNIQHRANRAIRAGWLSLFALLGLLAMQATYAQSRPVRATASTSTPPSEPVPVNAVGEDQSGVTAINKHSARDAFDSAAWQSYLRELHALVNNQPAVAAEQARLKAAQANINAQQGDLNLTLTGSYAYYPNGTGGSSNGRNVTNLQQRAAARVNWGLLGFALRRPGRIQHAKASAQQQKYAIKITRRKTQQALLQVDIAAWAAVRQRKALKHALQAAAGATDKLALAHHSSLDQITGATAKRAADAADLYNRIRSRLAGISHLSPTSPRVPDNYSLLPLRPPPHKAIARMAQSSVQAKSYLAQARAASGKAQSLWGNGIDLSVYAGYFAEKRKASNDLNTGPEMGLKLTIPISTTGHAKKTAAQWRAKAMQLQAKAAIVKRNMYLRQLRQKWASDVARLKWAIATMKGRAQLLHKMNVRAQHPAAGKAPEPWELGLQEAKFWVSVSKVWSRRRQWVQDALTWALYDRGFLQQYGRPGNASARQTLCAPLTSCKQT